MKNIYTDGSCTNFYNYRKKTMDGNKSGGIGVAIFEDGEFIRGISESYLNTTNQKMELLAIIRALQHSEGEITIFSDSQYSLNCSGRWTNSETGKEYIGWKFGWIKDGSLFGEGKSLKNLKYIQEINRLGMNRNVNFIWIRGHTGIHGNEIADELSCKRENPKICEYE